MEKLPIIHTSILYSQKLTKSSSELDEKRFEIYKHLDFDFKRKYNEKEYLYYADCYSFLCDKVVNDIELIHLYDKISLVYLKRINYKNLLHLFTSLHQILITNRIELNNGKTKNFYQFNFLRLETS